MISCKGCPSTNVFHYHILGLGLGLGLVLGLGFCLGPVLGQGIGQGLGLGLGLWIGLWIGLGLGLGLGKNLLNPSHCVYRDMKTITNLQAVHKYLVEHGNPEITKMFIEGLKEVHKTLDGFTPLGEDPSRGGPGGPYEKDIDEAFRLMDEIYAVIDHD